MADFSTDVTAWVQRAGTRANLAFRVIASDLVAQVQLRTPVDTGYLRSNWSAILQGEEEPVAGRTPPADNAIDRAKVGQVIIILNPVIYARRIEYGFVGEDSLGRYYNQSGRHMVAQTLAEIQPIAEAALRRVLT